MFRIRLIAITLLVLLGGGLFFLINKDQGIPIENKIDSSVTNFEECAKAGGHILESFPRQCYSAEGRLHVEKIKTPIEEGVVGACVRAGCSSQLCVEKTAGDIITTCEMKESYACYQKARCERQSNGQCGFTQTAELKACLNKSQF